MGSKKGALDFSNEDTLPLRGKSGEANEDNERQPEEEGNYRKSRVALAVFIILTIIIGVIFFIIGVVVLVAHYLTLRDLEFVINFTYIRICAIIFIVLGVVEIVVSIAGLIGTIKFSKTLLNSYAIGLAFVSFVHLLGGALLIILRGQVAEGSLQPSYLKNAIMTQYRVNVTVDPRNKFVTNVVDFIQENYQCCGAFGNVSSDFSWGIYKRKSSWYAINNKRFPMVPESCCVLGGNLERCQGVHGFEGPPIFGPAKECQEPYRYINDDLHKVGCYDAMKVKTEFYTLIFGIVLMALPALLMLLSSCCACRVLRHAH